MLLSLAILGLSALPAVAADLGGEWWVEDGSARIRLADCQGRLWGVVAWEKRHDVDRNNPDPSLRTRPTLGLPIIRGMHPVGANEWNGPIYNPKNGEMYQGKITVARSGVLDVEGCVLGGWICGGQKWTRVATTTSGVGARPAQNLCAALFDSSGTSHQSRLK